MGPICLGELWALQSQLSTGTLQYTRGATLPFTWWTVMRCAWSVLNSAPNSHVTRPKPMPQLPPAPLKRGPEVVRESRPPRPGPGLRLLVLALEAMWKLGHMHPYVLDTSSRMCAPTHSLKTSQHFKANQNTVPKPATRMLAEAGCAKRLQLPCK